MSNPANTISLRTAALIAGVGLLIMVIIAPYAEFYVYPKLVFPGEAAETTRNLFEHQSLFISGIFSYLVTCICDLVVAWALYILLKPVNEDLSLLTAGFRLVYVIIFLVALLNLFSVLRLMNTTQYFNMLTADQLNMKIMLSVKEFRNSWSFGFIFFSIHLILLGYLVFRSKYIPGIFGIILIINGIGYMVDTLKLFLFPNINMAFIMITFFGEVIFMVWLLIGGRRIGE